MEDSQVRSPDDGTRAVPETPQSRSSASEEETNAEQPVPEGEAEDRNATDTDSTDARKTESSQDSPSAPLEAKTDAEEAAPPEAEGEEERDSREDDPEAQTTEAADSGTPATAEQSAGTEVEATILTTETGDDPNSQPTEPSELKEKTRAEKSPVESEEEASENGSLNSTDKTSRNSSKHGKSRRKSEKNGHRGESVSPTPAREGQSSDEAEPERVSTAAQTSPHPSASQPVAAGKAESQPAKEEDLSKLSAPKPSREASRTTLAAVKFVGVDDRLSQPEDSLEKLALELEFEGTGASTSQPDGEESPHEEPPSPTTTVLDDARRSMGNAWLLVHEAQSFQQPPTAPDWLLRHTKAAELAVLELAEVFGRLHDVHQDVEKRRRSSAPRLRNPTLSSAAMTASLESLAAADARIAKSIYLHESNVRQLRQAVAASEQQENNLQLTQVLQQEEATARALQRQKAAIDASIKKTGFEIQKLERDAADQKRLQEEKQRLDDQFNAALERERQLQAQIEAVDDVLSKHEQKRAVLLQRQEGLRRLATQHGVSALEMAAAIRELRLEGALNAIPSSKEKLLFLLSERRKRRQHQTEHLEELTQTRDALLAQLKGGAAAQPR